MNVHGQKWNFMLNFWSWMTTHFFNNMTDIECLCRYIQCFSMFTIDRLTLKFLSTFSNILYQQDDFHEAKS